LEKYVIKITLLLADEKSIPAHILLRSSEIGFSGFMRRFLTGYAISYNRRHGRWGHLFQNRYKSIEELKSGSRRKEASGVRTLISIGW